MMRTHDNILMHELIGLECSVVSSANMFQTGITGKIADETMKNIVLENRGKMSTIQKKGTIVRKKINDIGLEAKKPGELCNSEKCPWHGHLKIRGRIFTGKVVSCKPSNTVIEIGR